MGLVAAKIMRYEGVCVMRGMRYEGVDCTSVVIYDLEGSKIEPVEVSVFKINKANFQK